MRVSAHYDLPWLYGGSWQAEAGLRSALGSQLDAMRQGTDCTPSLSAAEDVMIRRCAAAMKASAISRRLGLLSPTYQLALKLHFKDSKRLAGGISPAASLTSLWTQELAERGLADLKPSERDAIREETAKLILEAVRAYESTVLPEETYGTWDEPDRRMRVRYQ